MITGLAKLLPWHDSTIAVVPAWEEKKGEHLTLRVLKLGGWTPHPITKVPRKRKAQKGVPPGKF